MLQIIDDADGRADAVKQRGGAVKEPRAGTDRNGSGCLLLFLFEGALQQVPFVGYEDTVHHFPDIGTRMGAVFLFGVPFRIGVEDILGTIDDLRSPGHACTSLAIYYS